MNADTTPAREARPDHRPGQLAMGIAAVVVAAVLAYGAAYIPSDAGYAGVGPDFLPWLVAAALGLCGVMLILEVRSGGYRNMEEPSGAARGDWHALAWVAAGILGNAALITTLGFILSCALCYTLAVRGLRISEGRSGGNAMQALRDAVTGIVIAAPTYWLFTKFLAVNLPGLTGTGWI